MEKTLEELVAEKLAQAQAASTPPTPNPEYATKADITALLDTLKTTITDEVKKALPQMNPYDRGAGQGRVGQIAPKEITRESDPVAYLVKKSRTDEEWDLTDKQVVGELTIKALLSGLRLDTSVDEDEY